jgi:hypothetical protein
MGKKCIPGVICIENMTLFILFVISVLCCYLIMMTHKYAVPRQEHNPKIVVVTPNNISGQDRFNNPYDPPSNNTAGIPVNLRTRGEPNEYQQMGILTRTNNSSNDLIIPLMGRRIMNGRDKWQYYTVSGSGNLNTRLPISVSGKSCTSEHGCDSISNGDTVYVEGYNDTFQTTIYDNNLLQYIPRI